MRQILLDGCAVRRSDGRMQRGFSVCESKAELMNSD